MNLGPKFTPATEPKQHTSGETDKKILPRVKKPVSTVVRNVQDYKQLTAGKLVEIAESLNIEGLARFHKREIIFALLSEFAKRGEEIIASGVLEILQSEQGRQGGFGFLRSPEYSYLAGADDIYISPRHIKTFNFRSGDTITGKVRAPKDGEHYFTLVQVRELNNAAPSIAKSQILFENLTPLYPNEMLTLERGEGDDKDITGRVIDLIAPLGKGQRGLIVAPPKVGKTMMLQNIAQSITQNHPECYLMVLLVGERPEEVTDMRRSVKGEVIASTFDEPAKRHIQVAEIVIEKAKRLVEQKKNVVILMDSITRLARAYNTVAPSSGKVLTGGIDSNALQPSKRFFGAARNIEEGGSLTILATALIDTGSKMEDVIVQEFQGTGNMDIRLDRESAQKGIFPPINFEMTGTRREDLLITSEKLSQTWILRKILHAMDKVARIKFLIERLKLTKTNAEFFEAMKK